MDDVTDDVYVVAGYGKSNIVAIRESDSDGWMLARALWLPLNVSEDSWCVVVTANMVTEGELDADPATRVYTRLAGSSKLLAQWRAS